MDKLELDGRVACLERSVAILKVIVITALFVLGGYLVVGTMRRGNEAATVVPPAPPELAAFGAPTLPMPPVFPSATTEGSVARLAFKLRESRALQDKGYLTSDEASSLRAKLIAEPLTPGEFGADVEELGRLRTETFLSDSEFTRLKGQLLNPAK